MEERFIQSSFAREDRGSQDQLRPKSLKEFIGQQALCEKLNVFVGAAKKRNDTPKHCLFCGPPGLGKTTLASIMAEQMGTNLVTTSGPAIDKAGDLAGIITSLNEGDILFIDEIHRLSRSIEEYLYPAMEDYNLDIMLDSGPSARSVQVKLAPFTLVGATTRLGSLSSPLRSRFSLICRIDYYPVNELILIIKRSSHVLGMEIEEDAALEIANRARGTPRIANNLLAWVRDFAQMKDHGILSKQVVCLALKMLSIDDQGLDELDKKILSLLGEQNDGGPVGLQTLAASLGEEPATLADVYEPFLIMKGFIKRTPRGRELTASGLQHIKRTT